MKSCLDVLVYIALITMECHIKALVSEIITMCMLELCMSAISCGSPVVKTQLKIGPLK